MTFSAEWEAAYATGYSVRGTYPHFQKLIATYVAEADRMLELGPGLGANIAFLQGLGWGRYYGVEGSAAAVAQLHEQFPALRDRIACADFTREIPFEPGFDLVIDRASISHNDIESIRRCLDLIWDALKPGGLFIGSDWFATAHSELCRGEAVETNTRTGYPDGQFYGVGQVHFASESELRGLFSRFEGIALDERRIIRRRPFFSRPVQFRYISSYFADVDYTSALWDIVVRKPI